MTRFSLLFVIVALCCVCMQTSDAFPFIEPNPKVTVHIISGVPNTPKPLECRCQSGDDDLGMHKINMRDEFYWEFSPNIGFTTHLFLPFLLGAEQVRFDVYNKSLDHLCKKAGPTVKPYDCYWLVKPDGFYLSNDDKNYAKMNGWA